MCEIKRGTERDKHAGRQEVRLDKINFVKRVAERREKEIHTKSINRSVQEKKQQQRKCRIEEKKRGGGCRD